MEDVTPHYVSTLAEWRRRLGRSMAAERGGVPDRLLRTWEFYLALCEAGFASEHLSSLQMVFARPADAGSR
jgi:cyclopropane-fatty-acyl-phospholipid synthase